MKSILIGASPTGSGAIHPSYLRSSKESVTAGVPVDDGGYADTTLWLISVEEDSKAVAAPPSRPGGCRPR